MSDADLEDIRRARIQQLQQQNGGNDQNQAAQEQQQKQQQEREARTSILNQILTAEASDRLGRIKLVNQSRAEGIENRIIVLARSGQIQQKITDDQFKNMLASLSEQENASTGSGSVKKVVKRSGGWDDDDLADLMDDV